MEGEQWWKGSLSGGRGAAQGQRVGRAGKAPPEHCVLAPQKKLHSSDHNFCQTLLKDSNVNSNNIL